MVAGGGGGSGRGGAFAFFVNSLVKFPSLGTKERFKCDQMPHLGEKRKKNIQFFNVSVI